MKVLALFDGISVGKLALNNLHIPHTYHAIEIDEKARRISDHNHPDIIRPTHDVRDYQVTEHFDLVIGGSPCQDISIANLNGQDLEGAQSSLFWEFKRVVDEACTINPQVKFMLENVKAKNTTLQAISEALGVGGVYINSRAFLEQNRPRVYWTNRTLDTSGLDMSRTWWAIPDYAYWRYDKGWRAQRGSAPCVTAKAGEKHHLYLQSAKIVDKDNFDPSVRVQEAIQPFTLAEIEALQGLPHGYTLDVPHVSKQQKGKAIGNGWTLPVIEFIFEQIL
jgi:site-specific DNA-cytosine methylase